MHNTQDTLSSITEPRPNGLKTLSIRFLSQKNPPKSPEYISDIFERLLLGLERSEGESGSVRKRGKGRSAGYGWAISVSDVLAVHGPAKQFGSKPVRAEAHKVVSYAVLIQRYSFDAKKTPTK